MNYFIKANFIKNNGSVGSTFYSDLSKTFPGYMDKILEIILDPNLTNCQLTIGDFEFDVQHLRTLLK